MNRTRALRQIRRYMIAYAQDKRGWYDARPSSRSIVQSSRSIVTGAICMAIELDAVTGDDLTKIRARLDWIYRARVWRGKERMVA